MLKHNIYHTSEQAFFIILLSRIKFEIEQIFFSLSLSQDQLWGSIVERSAARPSLKVSIS